MSTRDDDVASVRDLDAWEPRAPQERRNGTGAPSGGLQPERPGAQGAAGSGSGELAVSPLKTRRHGGGGRPAPSDIFAGGASGGGGGGGGGGNANGSVGSGGGGGRRHEYSIPSSERSFLRYGDDASEDGGSVASSRSGHSRRSGLSGGRRGGGRRLPRDGPWPAGAGAELAAVREENGEGGDAAATPARRPTASQAAALADRERVDKLPIDVRETMEAVSRKLARNFGSVHKVFRRLDTEKRGAIPARSLAKELADMNLSVTDAQIRALVSVVDADNSGDISYDELKTHIGKFINPKEEKGIVDRMTGEKDRVVIAAREPPIVPLRKAKQMLEHKLATNHSGVRKVFLAFDKDHGGTISADELRGGLWNLGIRVADKDFGKLLRSFDLNADGEISAREFSKQISKAVRPSEGGGIVERLPHSQEGGGRVIKPAHDVGQVDYETGMRMLAGKLRSNYKKVNVAFRHLDADHSGSITRANLSEKLGEMGINVAESSVDRMMRALGATERRSDGGSEFGDGHSEDGGAISYKAFTRSVGGLLLPVESEGMYHMMPKGSDIAEKQRPPIEAPPLNAKRAIELLNDRLTTNFKEVRTVFRKFDEDHSGQIDREELRRGMEHLGIRVIPEDFDAVMSTFDQDGDGLVSYADFTPVVGRQIQGDADSANPFAHVEATIAGYRTPGSGSGHAHDASGIAAVADNVGRPSVPSLSLPKPLSTEESAGFGAGFHSERGASSASRTRDGATAGGGRGGRGGDGDGDGRRDIDGSATERVRRRVRGDRDDKERDLRFVEPEPEKQQHAWMKGSPPKRLVEQSVYDKLQEGLDKRRGRHNSGQHTFANKVRDAFKACLPNDFGALDYDHFRSGMRRQFDLSDKEVAQLFELANASGSGAVTVDTFADVFRSPSAVARQRGGENGGGRPEDVGPALTSRKVASVRDRITHMLESSKGRHGRYSSIATKLRDVFKKCGPDSTGLVTSSSFERGMREQFGLNPTEAAHLYDVVDPKRRGAVGMSAFARILSDGAGGSRGDRKVVVDDEGFIKGGKKRVDDHRPDDDVRSVTTVSTVRLDARRRNFERARAVVEDKLEAQAGRHGPTSAHAVKVRDMFRRCQPDEFGNLDKTGFMRGVQDQFGLRNDEAEALFSAADAHNTGAVNVSDVARLFQSPKKPSAPRSDSRASESGSRGGRVLHGEVSAVEMARKAASVKARREAHAFGRLVNQLEAAKDRGASHRGGAGLASYQAKIRQVFDSVPHDARGGVNYAQFKAGLDKHFDVSDAEAHVLFAATDVDGAGKVTMSQFAEAVQRKDDHKGGKHVPEHRDGDGGEVIKRGLRMYDPRRTLQHSSPNFLEHRHDDASSVYTSSTWDDDATSVMTSSTRASTVRSGHSRHSRHSRHHHHHHHGRHRHRHRDDESARDHSPRRRGDHHHRRRGGGHRFDYGDGGDRGFDDHPDLYIAKPDRYGHRRPETPPKKPGPGHAHTHTHPMEPGHPLRGDHQQRMEKWNDGPAKLVEETKFRGAHVARVGGGEYHKGSGDVIGWTY